MRTFCGRGRHYRDADTIRKKEPKRVLWENVFRSNRFQDIAIVDNITAAKKVARLLAPRD
jgi:hypothetical protein